MDIEKNIFENTARYLYKISEVLPNNLSIPKSYYASKCRILELKGGPFIPPILPKQSVRCPRCCLNLKEYPPSVQLGPKKKLNRFARKLLRKIEDGKNLTCFQQKFYSLQAKESEQQELIKTCRFCEKKIKIELNLEVKKKTKRGVIEDTPLNSSKKKRKGKDKYAGLKPSAVLSVNHSRENIKKNVVQILSDNCLNEADKHNKIKYNVVGCIEDKKKKKKKQKKNQKNNIEIQPMKSTKMKIMEKKEKKADLKQKNKIKNLLNESNSSTASHVLNGFLQTL